ncbi:MAG: ATP-binding cassette domain-containing protein, partial [Paracoccus sp. (in: a-proteobacteria)]
MSRIMLEGVTKRFGDHTAVDAMDLEIPDGSFFSLLGPSGCGKTTLMRLIAGFELPDAGRIVIGDRVVADARDLTHVPPARR